MGRRCSQEFREVPEGSADRHSRGAYCGTEGGKADIAKPLKGFGSGVFEVALKHRTDAYRTVYALQLGKDIWVLHAFQKKAKAGIRTPKKELDVVRERLKRLKGLLR